MLKIKDKYDYRKELIAELRSGKWKHGTGLMFIQETNSYCAYGVLAKMLNLEINYNGMTLKDFPADDYKPLMDRLGLTMVQSAELINANDESGFRAVATYLENLP